MKNIHLFEKKTDYDAAKSRLIVPRVSYIKDTKDVKYNPFNANGHDFVEIAGIKWATMNVGAKSITDYGCLYFQWGDTQGYTFEQISGNTTPKKVFNSSDYNKELFTKYNKKGMTLDLDDDAVHANWGGSWRMPTFEDFRTLVNNIRITWTDSYNNSGVAGMLCIAKDSSNKTLFFPACGCVQGDEVKGVGEYGHYWLSSTGPYDIDVYENTFNQKQMMSDYVNRPNGDCVRGVLAEN